MKGPAYNWAPMSKSLLYALVLMASPFFTPGTESLSQCLAWNVVYSSQRLEMFFESQLSDHSPAFCPLIDAHLPDLPGSQVLLDFPWLAPHTPMLKPPVTKLRGLLKSNYPCKLTIPLGTLFCLQI